MGRRGSAALTSAPGPREGMSIRCFLSCVEPPVAGRNGGPFITWWVPAAGPPPPHLSWFPSPPPPPPPPYSLLPPTPSSLLPPLTHLFLSLLIPSLLSLGAWCPGAWVPLHQGPSWSGHWSPLLTQLCPVSKSPWDLSSTWPLCLGFTHCDSQSQPVWGHPGVCTRRPAGHIWPTAYFYTACGLRMLVFLFLF